MPAGNRKNLNFIYINSKALRCGGVKLNFGISDRAVWVTWSDIKPAELLGQPQSSFQVSTSSFTTFAFAVIKLVKFLA